LRTFQRGSSCRRLFAAGPGRKLAASWFSDPATDYPKLRLQVSDDEHTWRKISTATAPKQIAGMAFASDGTLLVSNLSNQLWFLPPGGTTLRPLADGPRVDRLDTSGGMLIAYTGPRMIAVSTDGHSWTTLTPGTAAPGPGQPEQLEDYLLRRDLVTLRRAHGD
jgi:hypothetical protein